ncbi:apolipoprotein C-I-like [Varanus komodoensis]|uniref:apolipoprotein C-I-like n=1 Tax=Varanus komodoensis TaxID=61221 RepID=UPI001CF7A179|nr:apolipoprotein C-I-like [Varanus komodoensis]
MQAVVSIAVVLVALSVVAASDEPTTMKPTLSQKFEKFQQEVQGFFDRVGEKVKAAFHDLHHSKFSNQTRSWFAENLQTLKDKFATISNKESD